ncbi:hypothetical protein ACLOJK_019976 [Asimina triloba]
MPRLSVIKTFVTLQIPKEFPASWIKEGYTHLHFGAVRLALTFHGRKGLPVAAKIALLDSRFTNYQHARVGMMQTTLNAGTGFMTLYPNFNMPLSAPYLLQALKVQIQIEEAPMVSTATYAATLYYQIAYRVQNHALDMVIPGLDHSGQDSLIIKVDDSKVPVCTHAPKQISREQLLQLLPEKWLTAYEQLQKPPLVITRMDPQIRRLPGDQVEVSFPKPLPEPSSAPKIFSTTMTEINMISYAPMTREPFPVKYFSKEGRPIYQGTLDNGHKWYDNDCQCQGCLDDIYEEEKPRKARRNINKELQQRYEAGDPSVGLLGEPSGKFDYYVLYPQSPKPSPQPQPCHMISEDYNGDFPPLTPYQDTAKRTSYRHTTPDPSPQSQVTPAEACLNWANTNATAQNKTLQRIEQWQTQAQQETNSRLEILMDFIRQIHEKMAKLDTDIRFIIQNSRDMFFSPDIGEKERERKFLKIQLDSIQSEVDSLTAKPSQTHGYFSWLHKPMYTPNYQPQPLLPPSFMPQTQPTFEWRPKPSHMPPPSSEPVTSKPPTHSKAKMPVPEYVPIPDYIPESTGGASSRLPEDILPVEELNPIASFLRASALREYDSSEESEIELENIDDDIESEEEPVYMADPGPSVQHPDDPMDTKGPQPQAFRPMVRPQPFETESKFINPPHFSFDNTPPSQWKNLLDEWHAWILAKPRLTPHTWYQRNSRISNPSSRKKKLLQ